MRFARPKPQSGAGCGASKAVSGRHVCACGAIGAATDAPIGSEPGAQAQSPVAQAITQNARSEEILNLSRILFGPSLGNRLPKVIGNIRLREHELKSLLAAVEAMRRSPERTSFSNAPGPADQAIAVLNGKIESRSNFYGKSIANRRKLRLPGAFAIGSAAACLTCVR